MATKATKPIPDGYTTLTPHLTIKDAAAGIEFYKKAFGAEELFRMPTPDGKIMHAEIQIGNSRLMINEEMPDYGSIGPKALGGSATTLHIYVNDVDAFVEKATKAGATVDMPVDNMFWGDRYGKLSDPFGHKWSVATHIEDLTPEEMEEGMKKAFSS